MVRTREKFSEQKGPYSLVGTTGWRHITIGTEVCIQPLVFADKPRGRILTGNARSRPSKSIAS